MTNAEFYHLKSGAISAAEAVAMGLLRARIIPDPVLYEACLRCARLISR
jgi:hypothetical protein